SLKLAPGILRALAGQATKGNIIITGTNGKTTTAALIAHILKSAGYPVVSNSAGSNLSWGITTSLINASTWGGKLNRRYGVLEVDEGVFPGLAGQLHPAGAVITNIFPDQLDRFGTVDNIQQSIQRGLAAITENCFQVLNADDPFLASLQDNCSHRWYYGLEMPPDQNLLSGHQIQNYTCPHCRQILHYRQVFLAHLGHYRCPACGFTRPRPEVSLLSYSRTPEGTVTLNLNLKGLREEVHCHLPGSYNVYNLLAGLTAALALDIPVSTIKQALSSFSPANSRLKRLTLRKSKQSLVISLMKNAVGADQALEQVLDTNQELSLLIVINDQLADGVDVSWLWNARFEQLADCQERFFTLTVSGTRAWDMAVRLKYAGLDYHRIVVQKNLELALTSTLQATPPGKTVFILPNYTALAGINRAVRRLGII
ncbi:MAG TPA: DUF1727 domain-containing protein, partial [Firmicutes bacterium]|nr:DUF1727 domain-containing protein [Bacillota bacterium]